MINYLLCLLISFSILWTSRGAPLFIGDTLRAGEALNSSSFMVSASGEFTLGFYSGYLTVRSNNYTVWVANLVSPINDTSSALLTLLDMNKTLLQIMETGEKPVVLYSSPFIISTNVVATLTDSGSLVLQEVGQNVSNSNVLWQSIDEPNVALMPGMKLKSSDEIYSWQESQTSPGIGSLSLQWDSDKLQLQVWRDNANCWSSGGRFSMGGFEFINIPHESKVRYNFSVVSNSNENYFSYAVVGDQDVRSAWVLHTDGELYDVYNNISIVRAGDCDGFNTNGGCVRWGPAMSDYCGYSFSFINDFVMIKHGSFKPISMAPSINSTWPDSYLRNGDCTSTCWKDCDCLGFDFDNQTGCIYWSITYFHFLEDPASSTIGFVLPRKPLQRTNSKGKSI
uniref:G-type lectin S-receptor-like serine/threonine-protein kinase At2g19130 n=1 Tax=Fragaria vesca subsp. vesca TaxID=101020 RepID=UPI0005CADACD|nr:PREDICTED: G-type lectin S-receptor-like serine/threonine-protein kinase At2g19130 [Fragaria vesca subsp. vesca]